jgi:hypothetical protein
VTPFDQRYEVAPEAIKLALWPWQMLAELTCKPLTVEQDIPAVPKKLIGITVFKAFQLDKHIINFWPHETCIVGSKSPWFAPIGSVDAIPVNPWQLAFQLHRIGAKLFVLIWLMVEIPLYGHIIQSRHLFEDVLGAPNENSSVPALATFTISQLLFISPVNKQPEFVEAGFVDGLEKLPTVNSVISPLLDGSNRKVGLVQMLTAWNASLAETGVGGTVGVVPQGFVKIFANQPDELTLLSEVKIKVKQPDVEVKFVGR